jgi:para-nitrobenzyl esterase
MPAGIDETQKKTRRKVTKGGRNQGRHTPNAERPRSGCEQRGNGGNPRWAIGNDWQRWVQASSRDNRRAVDDDASSERIRQCVPIAPVTLRRPYPTARLRVVLALGVLTAAALTGGASDAAAEARRVEGGMIANVQPDSAGVRSFKGIPFAAPPIRELRWRAPQAVMPWEGERSADQFGPKCMQTGQPNEVDPVNPLMGEDCLYLNVWTPAKSFDDRLPVMVWIYGGGFKIGSGSEPWYNGANLAKKGVIVVTVNYRLDVFGFLSHPDLTAESKDHASGNYGLLDQIAALGWVKRNIAAFGGDPGQTTVFGESAGSISVSALMASPLAHGLFQRVIGESGAMLFPNKSPYALAPLAKAEQAGVKFADLLSAHSIAELREKPAEALLDVLAKNPDIPRMSRGPIIDGQVLPVSAVEIFAKGQQTDVPLLAGSTSDEGTLFTGRAQQATPESYTEQLRQLFGDTADAVRKLYPVGTPEETKSSFALLFGDQLIAYPTWLWNELQARTGKAPTYRYLFELTPPAPELSKTPLAGAFHTAEIVYVFDNLKVRNWPWRPEDRRMAEIASSYWVNFAKSGNPNGPGLPDWPAYTESNATVMRLDEQSSAGLDPRLARYELLNQFYFGKGP